MNKKESEEYLPDCTDIGWDFINENKKSIKEYGEWSDYGHTIKMACETIELLTNEVDDLRSQIGAIKRVYKQSIKGNDVDKRLNRILLGVFINNSKASNGNKNG